jgi:hypothetical protein
MIIEREEAELYIYYRLLTSTQVTLQYKMYDPWDNDLSSGKLFSLMYFLCTLILKFLNVDTTTRTESIVSIRKLVPQGTETLWFETNFVTTVICERLQLFVEHRELDQTNQIFIHNLYL